MAAEKEEKETKPSETLLKILIRVNGVMVSISLLTLGAGVFLKVGTSLVVDQLRPLIAQFMKEAYNAGLQALGAEHVDVGIVIEKLGLPLIAVGLYALAMSATGLFAGKMRIVIVMIPYTVFLGIGILAQLVLLLLLGVHRQLLDGIMLPMLMDSIREYRGYNETNPESQIWSIAMVMFRCCGASNYKDFNEAKYWRRQLYQDGWWFELETPLPCCHLDGRDPYDFSCAVNPSPYTSYFQKGCYAEIWSTVEGYKVFVIVVAVLLLLLQVVLFACTAVLIYQLVHRDSTTRKKDHSDSENGLDSVDENSNNTSKSSMGHDGRPDLRAGLAEMARNLAGAFPGFRNPDCFQEYFNAYRRNTSAGDILSQFLIGSPQPFSQQPYTSSYGNYNMPMYHDSQRGPVIVQLPSSPQLNPVPKLHDRAMIAIEGPDEHPDLSGETDSSQDHRRFKRCQSDGNIIVRPIEDVPKLGNLSRRGTYRY